MWHLTFCLFFLVVSTFFLNPLIRLVFVCMRESFSRRYHFDINTLKLLDMCYLFAIYFFFASTKQIKTGLMYRIICEHDNENCYFITNTNATVTAYGMWILIFFLYIHYVYIKTEIFFNDFIFRSRNLIRSKMSMSCWQ